MALQLISMGKIDLIYEQIELRAQSWNKLNSLSQSTTVKKNNIQILSCVEGVPDTLNTTQYLYIIFFGIISN